MGQLITIDDQNFHHHVHAPVGVSKGLVPRNFQTHPVGYLGKVAEPLSLPLMTDDEIEAAIKDEAANGNSLQHLRDRGMFGQRIPSRDQNGKGYCWAHSTVSAALLVRASMGLPYKDLSAYMIACIIKGYRDEGGWNGESLKFATEKGIATSATWAQQSMSRSNENAAMWADAALNRCSEWWDLSEDRNTVKRQIATLSLGMKVPIMGDFNWWSHSVCISRVLSWNPFKIRIWNSWGDTWSDAGMGDLADSKAIPDGAAAPRVLLAA